MEPLLEPLDVEFPLSHPCWQGPSGAADPCFLPAMLQHAQRGLGVAETSPLRSAMSFGWCWLLSPAAVLGCSPQWAHVHPLGPQRPDPTARFPSFAAASPLSTNILEILVMAK